MSCSRDEHFMRMALSTARKGYGRTSPNPMVGAILVKGGQVAGIGWHRRAGGAHAEVEAIRNASNPKGSILYVTLEPCSTVGRTPPCTEIIKRAGVKRVVAATVDPNLKHRARGFAMLRHSGIETTMGVLRNEAVELNAAFNHWIVKRTPLITVKLAMTLDGRIATAKRESKWITGPAARRYGHFLRKGSDAILVGVNTVIADDPSLTVKGKLQSRMLRRIILDSNARIPLNSKVLNDSQARATTIVTTINAPKERVAALAKKVNILTAPVREGQVDLQWLVKQLGCEEVSSLLVEGGGLVGASFFKSRLAHRIAFFYAPKILGGNNAKRALDGDGVNALCDASSLENTQWTKMGRDLLLTAQVSGD